MGAIPHPANDAGGSDKTVGHRLRLKLADGDPDFHKHHGAFWGVSTAGNWVVDTTQANDGTIGTDGSEPAPPTDGKGSQTRYLPQHAEKRAEWWDMTNPSSPVTVAREVMTKDQFEVWLKDKVALLIQETKFELKLQTGATVLMEGKDATAKLTLGNCAKSATISEHLETLYGNLKSALEAWYAFVTGHVHPTAWGPSNTSPTLPGTLTVPAWTADIQSTHLKIPDL